MRKVFISYARQNKPDIEQLVEHLRVLGCDTWHDSSLHGGQDWWEEILRRIADCDTFIAIISHDALSSTACRREFDWAESLSKPILPVAVEPPPKALPRRFSKRQIVDYSDPTARDRAALTLAGGLATLSAAPPLPHPLPEPPATPLSYLTDLTDLVTEQKALDHDQQRHILNQLESALRSVDPEERRGGRDILEMLTSRDDLYADVYRTISRLKDIPDGSASLVAPDPAVVSQSATTDLNSIASETPAHQKRDRAQAAPKSVEPQASTSLGPPADTTPAVAAALDDAPSGTTSRSRPEVPTHRQETTPERLPPTPPSSPWWRRKAALISGAFIVTAVAVVLAITLGTTGKHPASQSSQTALPDAATLLAQSAETTRNLKSAHLEQTVQGKVEHMAVKKMSADLANSPAVAAKGHMRITLAGGDVEADFVVIDGTLYGALTPNQWSNFGPASDIWDVSVLLNPDTGLANILRNFTAPKADGRETINGLQTVKITGQVSGEAVAKIAAKIASTPTVPATAWIREDGDHDLVQVTLEPSPGNSLQITLSEWNEPVTVEKPPGS